MRRLTPLVPIPRAAARVPGGPGPARPPARRLHRPRRGPAPDPRRRFRPSPLPPGANPNDRFRLRQGRRPRLGRLGESPPRRSVRSLRRGRRRHHRLRPEPHPRRRRLELDQPAGRRRPPRHRRPRGVQRRCSAKSGIGPDTHDRALRRQQQLVRRLGLLAAAAVRARERCACSTAAASSGSTTTCRCRPTCRPTPATGYELPRGRLLAARVPRRHPAARRRRGARARRRPLARPSSTARSSPLRA